MRLYGALYPGGERVRSESLLGVSTETVRDTLNCSIFLLLTDASASLFQSSMVHGKNKSLQVFNLQLYGIKVWVLVELFLVVRVFNLRYSSAGMHTITFMIFNNIASRSDFLLSDRGSHFSSLSIASTLLLPPQSLLTNLAAFLCTASIRLLVSLGLGSHTIAAYSIEDLTSDL